MKRTFIRTLALVLVLACAFSVFGIPAAGAEKSMKSIKGISWDLKEKKDVDLHVKFNDVGAIVRKARITKLSVKQTSDTMKTAYITFIVDNPQSISEAQVHKIIQSKTFKENGSVSSGYYYTVVDYKTGTCLEVENSLDVKVKSTEKYSTEKKFRDEHGCNVWTKKWTVKLEITYPATYTGLCFGIGTFKKDTRSDKVTSYFEGKVTFDKVTDMYDKNHPEIAHFMRIK